MDRYAKDYTLFKNGDHLNFEGATIFSKQVASELAKIFEEMGKVS
jgi:hypothetical protein